MVVEALACVATQGGYTFRREQGAGDGTRPGDLFLPRLNSDGPAAVNFTIRYTLVPAPQFSQRPSRRGMPARKRRKSGSTKRLATA